MTADARPDAPAALPPRNHLVWIDAEGWREIERADWDAQARDLLAHWRLDGLPLVVTVDRPQASEQPTGLPPERPQLSLGLPAPMRWQRRRLALRVAARHVRATGRFPMLGPVSGSIGDDALRVAAQALDRELAGVGARARVYGSHGWQVITGLACTAAASDLDLQIEVDDVAQALAAWPRLASARLPLRLDGEFAFPDGQAVAWREFGRACEGRVDHVLVKRRGGVRLLPYAQLR